MSLNSEIFKALERHFLTEKLGMSEALATLTNHIIILIQSLVLSPEDKLSTAEELVSIVLDEIKNNPNPIARSLN